MSKWLFVLGRNRLVRVDFLLHTRSKTQESNQGRGRHYSGHDEQDRAGGIGKVESNESGDRRGHPAGLRLSDPACLDRGLGDRQSLGDQERSTGSATR